MKLRDACMLLGRSEYTLAYHFDRVKSSLQKKGILLEREGVGKHANFKITYPNGMVIDSDDSLVIIKDRG